MNISTTEKEIKVLHVYPGSSLSNFKHSGGSKGIEIFNEFFNQNNINYDNCIIEKKSDLLLLSRLKEIDLHAYSHILIHYPMFSMSTIYLKIFYPKLNLITRSHNAEFPHWIQHSFLEIKNFKIKKGLKFFLIAIRNGFGEMVMGFSAKHILAITEWETNTYWKKFAFSKPLYTPYYISQLSEDRTNEVKNNQCICLMSPNHSSFLNDAAKNFYNLVGAINPNMNWSFAITGEDLDISFDDNIPIDRLGFVNDIRSLLRQSKSIAVLTNYGYGFKTKILEAAEEGCWSLVPIENFSRIPTNVKPFCIAVDIFSPKSFMEALNSSDTSLPDFNFHNNELKHQFHDSLKKSLLN